MTSQNRLHPRNRHREGYDFAELIALEPTLSGFLIRNRHDKPSIDFADPTAVKLLNRALLKQHYAIYDWSLPEGFLCPPIPGRADYLHYLADLLGDGLGGRIPCGPGIRVLDIGVGANCIYPLIGQREYGWRFVGTDIDDQALQSAADILAANPDLYGAIELRRQTEAAHIFPQMILPEERFELTLCNPPFHASLEDAYRGNKRKWKKHANRPPAKPLPLLSFGGRHHELHCPGGELAFISTMIEESRQFAGQVFWFSTLVAKCTHLPAITQALQQQQVAAWHCIDMAQGRKRSRFVAWTFLDHEQRRAWQNKIDSASK